MQPVGDEAAASDGTWTWRNDSLELACGATHFLTVRATNCAGLRRTVASAGAKLCCDGPVAGAVELSDGNGDAVLYLGAQPNVSVLWEPFHDGCSGVDRYAVSVRHAGNGSEVWGSEPLPPGTGSLELPADLLAGLRDGAEYAAAVVATSAAGLASEASSSFVVELALQAFSRAAATSRSFSSGYSPTTCAPLQRA